MTRSKLQLTNTTKSMAANKKKGGDRPLIRNGRHRVVAALFFLLYFIVLFYFLFFSEELGRTYSERAYHYNLIPFHEIKRFIIYRRILGWKAVVLNIWGNIIAFMPFGAFLPIYASRCRKLWITVLYSFELSLLVELLQLVLKVGSFDVDDLLLNTIGGLLGYLVCKGVLYLRRKTEKTGNSGNRQ